MSTQWLSVLLAFVSVILIPMAWAMLRMAIRWTRVEDKLEQLVTDMKHIVADKDKTHTELQTQMTNDRQATDKRLRWLEEYLWKRGQQP